MIINRYTHGSADGTVDLHYDEASEYSIVTKRLASHEPPSEAFLQARRELARNLEELLELPIDTRIKRVRFSRPNNNTLEYQVELEAMLPIGEGDLKITCPKFGFAVDPETYEIHHLHGATEELTQALRNLEEQCRAYLRGDRAQGELRFESEKEELSV